MKVPTHGLHKYKDIWYLLQGQNKQNALGLKNSPELSVTTRTPCPHNIDLQLPPLSQELIDLISKEDPLVTYMIPLPKKEFHNKIIECNPLLTYYLSYMSSPMRQTIIPIWAATHKILKPMLDSSNITTWIITDVNDVSDLNRVKALNTLASCSMGKILFVGSLEYVPADIERIETKFLIDQRLNDLDIWKRYGAMLLREYMRDENT